MKSKKLWRILRAVYYVIKKGTITRRKLVVDIQDLLKRSKLSGKAIANILSINSTHDRAKTAFIYNPREVEFSCTNSPSHVNKRKNRNWHRDYSYDYASDDVVPKSFEMLDDEVSDAECSVVNSPAWGFLKSGLRVTDSPFLIKEEEECDGGVDEEADEFIKKFYQQLRKQPVVPMTPMYEFGRW